MSFGRFIHCAEDDIAGLDNASLGASENVFPWAYNPSSTVRCGFVESMILPARVVDSDVWAEYKTARNS
jgi:hypothetical protein